MNPIKERSEALKLADEYAGSCVLGGGIRYGKERAALEEELSRQQAEIDELRAALAALRSMPAEPVAWMYQHDETGRTGFVDCWQVENGWQANNPRLHLIGPLYTTPHTAPLSDAWISVDERLPEPWTEVLISPRPTDYCCEGQVDHKGQWTYSEYEAYNGNVTHKIKPKYWMPMPPPPIERAVLGRGGEQ